MQIDTNAQYTMTARNPTKVHPFLDTDTFVVRLVLCLLNWHAVDVSGSTALWIEILVGLRLWLANTWAC